MKQCSVGAGRLAFRARTIPSSSSPSAAAIVAALTLFFGLLMPSVALPADWFVGSCFGCNWDGSSRRSADVLCKALGDYNGATSPVAYVFNEGDGRHTCQVPATGQYLAEIGLKADCPAHAPRNPSTLRCTCPEGQGYNDTQRSCRVDFHQDANSKMYGRCDDCAQGVPPLGNPINPAIRNKFQIETDLAASTPHGLSLVRAYNSIGGLGDAMGQYWQHNYQRTVHRLDGSGAGRAVREDGRAIVFSYSSAADAFGPDADVRDRLEWRRAPSGQKIGYLYRVHATDTVEEYDFEGKLVKVTSREGLVQTLEYSTDATPPAVAPKSGLLIKVADHFGRELRFTYDALARITTTIDTVGGVYTYAYNANNSLGSVTYPDGKIRTYLYEEPTYVYSLTGLIDENGIRHATWTYATGRALTSELAGGVNRADIQFFDDSSTRFTDGRGQSRLLSFTIIHGVRRLTGIDLPSQPQLGPSSQTFDANGNIASRTDWNSNRTNYTYDLVRNLETQRVEGLTSGGATTPQTRTISTEWHATFRLPTGIAEPLRITTNVYDADGTQCGARGALCSKTIQATTDPNGSLGFSATPTGSPRTWSYTYNANGSVETVNSPRTDVADVTTYTYYPNNDPDLGKRGHVATITNAAGHRTDITAYNAHGRPLTIVDPNGLTTRLTYDARQRLKTREVGSELTTYDYDGVGQLTKVTLPDGSFLSYSYDAAHRLTGMQDNQANRIAYTLDAMGNRTKEEVFDPAGSLAQTRSRVYSNLNRLFQELGAQNQTTEYGYDNQGNVASVKDPLNRITSNQYDALNRLKQVTDPGLGVTQYGYNGLDALTQVADPRNLVTGYMVDGLGNLTQQASPDTGDTVNTYDAAGNLLTQTDAKGQVTTYVYDALNRVTLITFHDGSKQAYAYDLGTNGLGRLASITEINAANQQTSLIAYVYDQHGRVASETRTVNGVQYVLAYRHDVSGRLDRLTYPSGRTVSYAFDSVGRVSQVTTTKEGPIQTVVQNVAYHPFGGVKSYTLGNGQTYTRGYDLDARIASYTQGAKTFGIGYDAASRIEFISEVGNPANSNTYGYDSLDRLTQAVIPGTPFAYVYDSVGNRTSKTVGSSTDTYSYSSTSNRIASITPGSGPIRNFVFDANGSTTADGANTYAHDARGRMVQATSVIGATNYQVNALGQRIRKTNSQTDRIFHYDTRGKLIAETDPGGGLIREYLYLGEIPVAVVAQ